MTISNGPEIVAICGSTRFRAEIAEANRMLTLAGAIVLAPGVFAHDGDEITEEQKVALDALHFRKIDLAAWIYVVNVGGYTGESTQREIAYARRTCKGVRFLETVHFCPPPGSSELPCCGRTPFDLLRTDRMTLDPGLVTCEPGIVSESRANGQSIPRA